MAEAASEAGVLLMEAFHWRYHPMAQRMVEVIQSGQIGRVRRLRSHFNVEIQNPENIRLNYEMGGGATMDLGCHGEPSSLRIEGHVNEQGQVSLSKVLTENLHK